METDAVGARRLASEGHVGRVSAKRSDVFTDPEQGRALIEEAVIARASAFRQQRSMAEESKRPQSIVGLHDDGFGQSSERLPVLWREVRRRIRKSAWMQPYDHRRA
jgi:hypothetical protein